MGSTASGAVQCGMKLTTKVGEMLENVRRKNEVGWMVEFNKMNRILVKTIASTLARRASQLKKAFRHRFWRDRVSYFFEK